MVESETGSVIGNPWSESSEPPESGVADVDGGDVLFGKLRPYLAKVVLARGVAYASTELLCLRPSKAVDSRWLAYAMLSCPVIDCAVATSEGTKMPRTSWERLGGFVVPTPPLAEQRAIADFLDAETARIDALIAKKGQLMFRIMDRSEHLIEREVLGLGGHQAAPARSFWFDSVPQGWDETTLRHCNCEVQTGPFGSQLHSEEYVEGGWPVVNPSNLVGGRITAIESMTISDEKREDLARHVLHPGDIVFGRRGEMGRAGLVGEAEAGWLCGTGSLRLRAKGDRLVPGYLKILLETRALRGYFALASVGSTMDNLNSDILLSAPVLIPATAEQWAIVDQVQGTQLHAQELGERIVRQVSLLRERRQALITAAVTGELDIPGVAA
ncbi:MAG TPA: restriction endonuclease subunit S [Acidimicrobiales bacterium]|nr:restriction endonuclease subunit S [Acidimicrobiales bacterium]